MQIIRHAMAEDLDRLAAIEAASYPPLEGAPKESIRNRIAYFPECFWILEEDGKILSFINGFATNEKDLTDEMYDHPEEHDPDGKWQMIFSVVTAPEARKKGYASAVMEQLIRDVRAAGRNGIVLTCKERLIPFYARFGYVDEGVSDSTHGNVVWHQMRLVF